jgi:amino acid adenylation domain-containing protein/thioester reductase-like protein
MLANSNTTTIHRMVEAQVALTPAAIAVTYQNQQLTYQQMNQQANQLAHHLQGLGVGANVLVGVCVERSLELVVTLLAILKAGGAYVPLDISYPADRLSYMLENAQAPILITQSHLLSNLPQEGRHVICLDRDREEIAANHIENLNPDVTPEHLAYVIYTSGSTGKPKGVAMPHGPLVNLLQWQAQDCPTGVGSKTLQFTPVSFDVSFQEIFSTLSAGGTLVMIADEMRRNPITLLRFLQQAQIERLFLPFVALRQLSEVAEQENCVPTALREVITAGEQLRVTSTIIKWFSQLTNCRLHNHYGPSESHVVTAFTLAGSPENWPALPPIGRPIDNTEILLLDAQLQPVPVGVSGELYISGACLARDYLNRPDLTAERFIPNPFRSGERLYKAGDLARCLPDGNIEYLGRVDQQVKIRGFRIEPGEIEAELEKHPQVKEAVVITRESSPGEQRLVAYITANRETPKANTLSPTFTQDLRQFLLTRELREFLRSRLPEYMLPSALVLLESFPLTPSGKVDRRALPIPKWTRMEEGNYVAPRNPLEQQLAEIWTELLDIDRVGIHDRFCELGGHSLSAIRLIYKVKEALQIELPVESFLEEPTIAGMATAIEALRQTQDSIHAAQNWEAEALLDPSIYPENLMNGPIPQVFLTGATGFLGATLLYELLKQTRADIYCLVRASSPAEALSRLKSNMKRYQLWEEGFGGRIFLVLGDLGKPHLGIDTEKFARLAEKIDTIYHCGAWVNVIYPYSVLKAANVNGTQDILRLASQFRVKPVHFVSTIDVFAPVPDGIRTITAGDEPGPGSELFNGYAQSKYIAEQLVMGAHLRGIPVTIYRPSNIMGHTQTGICQASDFVPMMIKGCIQMGMAPELNALLNLVPADFVSQAIVQLSRQTPCGRGYQIVNPNPMTWQQLVQWMMQQGYPLQQVDYETWYSKLLKLAANETTDNALASLAPVFANRSFVKKSLGAFAFNNQGAPQYSCVPTPNNHELLQTYFNFFTSSGFLPANQGKLHSLA